MSKKNLFLGFVFCSGFFFVTSCSNPKDKGNPTDQKKTEQFSTDLPDGEYLVDSSVGVKTYAIVKAKKLTKFRATTFDGKPSKMGVVNLRAKMQLQDDSPSPESLCFPPCKWTCSIDIFTGKETNLCSCICTGLNTNGLSGMEYSEILGPSFGEVKVSEVITRIIFEIEP